MKIALKRRKMLHISLSLPFLTLMIMIILLIAMMGIGSANEDICGVHSDSFVHEDTPTVNYGHSSLLAVGRESNGADALAFIRFNMCIPPNARIDEAWLRLWRFNDPGRFNIKVRTVQEYWVEHLQITYNNQPSLGAPTINDYLDDRDNILIEITEIFEYWYYNEGTYNNFGIALTPYNSSIPEDGDF